VLVLLNATDIMAVCVDALTDRAGVALAIFDLAAGSCLPAAQAHDSEMVVADFVLFVLRMLAAADKGRHKLALGVDSMAPRWGGRH
jgi:hypothetical protein